MTLRSNSKEEVREERRATRSSPKPPRERSPRTFVAIAVIFAAIGPSSACSEAPPQRAEQQASAPVTRAFDFAGEGGARSQVTRAISAGGAETLRGETDLRIAGAERRIVEEATIDTAGRLVRASFTALRGPGALPEERVTLDFARGVVLSSTAEGQREWRVPSGAPWVYVASVAGRRVVTPVAAWVARRGAAAAPKVTLIDVQDRESHIVPRDQIAVETEAGTTLVLDDFSADLSGGFIDRVRHARLGVMLSRGVENGS